MSDYSAVMNGQSNKAGVFSGWRIMGILFFAYMFTMGFAFYAYTVLFPAMVEDLGWNRGTASIAQTLNILLMGGLFPPLMALSMNKFGAKKSMVLGSTFLIMGLILLGTLTSHIWQFVLFWGVFVSFGFSFAGAVPVQNTLFFWFSKKRAMALGIVMTGGAVGGFIAQPMYTWVLQNTGNWQTCWRVAGGIAVVSLILVLFLINKPQDVGQFPDGIDPEQDTRTDHDDGKKGNAPFRTTEKWLLKEIFKTPQIYFLILMSLAYTLPLFLITSHGVLHFVDGGLQRMQAASILSATVLASGIARLPAGLIADRFEPRWIAMAVMAAMFASMLGLWKLNQFNMLLLSGIVFGICFGTMTIIHPIIMGNYYGPESFASIMGTLGPFTVLFMSSVPVASGFIYEEMGNYNCAFFAMFFFILIAGVAAFFLKPPHRKQIKI
jgi:MFS family permease